MIAKKRKEPYLIVINHICTKLRFSLLRSTLAAVWGFREEKSNRDVRELRKTDMGLITTSATSDG